MTYTTLLIKKYLSFVSLVPPDVSMKICKFINGDQYQTYPIGHFSNSNSNHEKDCLLCKFVSGLDVGCDLYYIPDDTVYARYVEIEATVSYAVTLSPDNPRMNLTNGFSMINIVFADVCVPVQIFLDVAFDVAAFNNASLLTNVFTILWLFAIIVIAIDDATKQFLQVSILHKYDIPVGEFNQMLAAFCVVAIVFIIW